MSAGGSPGTTASTGGDVAGQVFTGSDGLAVAVARYIPYKSTATALGSNAIARTTLPIPPGMVPVVLNGTLTAIADNPGVVRIRVGTSSIELDATQSTPWTLPVPFDAIEGNNVTVEIRNTLDVGEGECVSDSTTTETISDLVLGFIGRETPPTTIAGFFSPPVQKVTVISPDEPTLATAAATLAAAGSLAKRYDNQTPIVPISAAAFAADPNALRDVDGPKRIVRLVPDDTDKVTVTISNPGVPTMTLSGPPDKLAEAAGALATVNLGLAAVPVATELDEQQLATSFYTLTLADLGAEKPSMAGLGRQQYAIGVGQGAFGGPVEALQIHIEGVHTPTPVGGTVIASLVWNDQIIQSQSLADNDQYLADASVPPSLVNRDNVLILRLEVTPPGGGCTGAAPNMQLDVNGFASTITATPGQSLPQGFARFPQAFGETLHLCFGTAALTPQMVNAASSLVISLQRSSGPRLNIELTDFADFTKQTFAGVVVGATPDDADTLKAPLRFEPWRAVNDARTEFTVTVDAPFSALEAFEFNGRNVLMLGATAPFEQSQPLMNKLADYTRDNDFGWFGLDGSLAVAQSQAEVFTLSPVYLVPQESVTAEGRALPIWLFVLIGLFVLVVLARFITVRLRSRRVASRVRDLEAQSPDEDDLGDPDAGLEPPAELP